jgi:hypothetical protein
MRPSCDKQPLFNLRRNKFRAVLKDYAPSQVLLQQTLKNFKQHKHTKKHQVGDATHLAPNPADLETCSQVAPVVLVHTSSLTP